MPVNQSDKVISERLITEIKELKRQVKELKTNQLSRLVIPKFPTDPALPIEGELWENTTSHTYKVRINGLTKTVTIT